MTTATIYADLLAAGWGEQGRPNTVQHRRWSLFEDAVENAVVTVGSYDLDNDEWHSIFNATVEFLVGGAYQDLAHEYDTVATASKIDCADAENAVRKAGVR